ncbi:MAG: hypothetical protein KDD41_10045 [Flavobacteriales bacterium]|nr:hypothetical protein [Flavobacteriales bacterium]
MSMKDNDYMCPKCRGHLNVDGNVIFATRTKRNHKGLLMLSPKVGEYRYKHHDKFQLEKGEMVDFECPICQADLTADKKDHAMILMVGSEDNMEYRLYFSKVAGNRSTYLVANDNVEAFGEDAMDFDELLYD